MTCPGTHTRTSWAGYIFECACGRTELCNAKPEPVACRTCADRDGICRICGRIVDIGTADTERLASANCDEEFPEKGEAV
jgi:hypothetical protein